MLLSFRVENHKSIREEQQLLLTPTYDDARPESADWEAVTVAGVFGANASGKSNLLDALSFMRNTVRWSMNNGEPGGGIRREPFALDAEAATDPSVFVVDLMLSGVRHTYGFAIDDAHVTEEWLYTYPKRRKRVVFERDGGEFEFGDSAPAKMRQVRDITSPNVLLLTVAARASNEEVEPVYRWFSDGLRFAEERNSGIPGWLRDGLASEGQMEGLSELLRSAGTGVHTVELREGAFAVSARGGEGRARSTREILHRGLEETFERFWERSVQQGEGKVESALVASDWLRGNKLFGEAGSYGESLVPPWPSVAAGAIRSALLVCKGMDPERFAKMTIEVEKGFTPEQTRAEVERCGVRNLYERPEQLGPDRWAALIAARALHSSGPALVVNAGTATTVDMLSGDGRFLGGSILPGVELMRFVEDQMIERRNDLAVCALAHGGIGARQLDVSELLRGRVEAHELADDGDVGVGLEGGAERRGEHEHVPPGALRALLRVISVHPW